MRSGSSVILMALAVADTLTLAIGPTSRYLQTIHSVYLNDYFIICKFHKYLKSVLGYWANWLVIIFTIFRVIAVYWPHKANVFCTRKRALIAVGATFLICCLIHLDYIIHVQRFVHVNNRGHFAPKKCWFEGPREIYYRVYSQWVMLVFMSIIPFFVLLVGNALIIRKVLIYSIKRKRMSNDVKSNDSQSMTAMLISISVLFLVTQVPAVVISTIKRNVSSKTHSKEYLYTFLDIDTIFRMLKWSNHAVNFFCYCVSGKRFRQELVVMVTGRFRTTGQLNETMVTKSTTVTPPLSR